MRITRIIWQIYLNFVENWFFQMIIKTRLIKEIRAPHGEIVKVYDTDRHVIIGRVKDDYCIEEDLRKMSEIIHNVKVSNKRNAGLYKNDNRITKYHRMEHVRT